MNKIWNWFSGKKVVIASICLIAAKILDEVIIGIWSAQGEWLFNLINTLEWFGATLGAAGLIHKIVKVKKSG